MRYPGEPYGREEGIPRKQMEWESWQCVVCHNEENFFSTIEERVRFFLENSNSMQGCVEKEVAMFGELSATLFPFSKVGKEVKIEELAKFDLSGKEGKVVLYTQDQLVGCGIVLRRNTKSLQDISPPKLGIAPRHIVREPKVRDPFLEINDVLQKAIEVATQRKKKRTPREVASNRSWSSLVNIKTFSNIVSLKEYLEQHGSKFYTLKTSVKTSHTELVKGKILTTKKYDKPFLLVPLPIEEKSNGIEVFEYIVLPAQEYIRLQELRQTIIANFYQIDSGKEFNQVISFTNGEKDETENLKEFKMSITVKRVDLDNDLMRVIEGRALVPLGEVALLKLLRQLVLAKGESNEKVEDFYLHSELNTNTGFGKVYSISFKTSTL